MIKRKLLLTLVLFSAWNTFSQRPREIQLDSEPFDFTDPFKLIFVVGIPVLLLIIGAIYIRNKRNKK